MSQYQYERLGVQDNAFLLWETPEVHMHVSTTMVFRAGPLRTEDGGVDFERIKKLVASKLHLIPRYRERLQWIPRERHAVWVDDPHFSLDYHVRHTGLPRPGSDNQLKTLSARIMAQALDRARPLWEMWVVEGLSEDRFALVTKLHHCMIDGTSGMEMGRVIFAITPDEVAIPQPREYVPRPAPNPLALWRDELQRRATLPLRAVRNLNELRHEADGITGEIGARLRAVGGLLKFSASDTPINGPLGPHRVFEWLDMDLGEVKAVKDALGCTVNDTVLTIVTGAFRDYFLHRRADPERLRFMVQAPVSVRSEKERGNLGNRVSGWTIDLPIGESEPRKQLASIHATTQQLKKKNQALGIETINTIAEWTTSSLLSLAAQAARSSTNSIVTNVPGPQFPFYLLGAEQLAMYPQAPLLPNMGLAVGLISYNGRVCWGITADLDRVPDLDFFAELVQGSFQRLAKAVGVELRS
jgi:WS/DGAT/MGAT family acyltransferase